MLKCQESARGLFSRDRGETETLKTEHKTKAFSLKAEARPRHLKFQLRRDQAEALLHLETKAPRSRPHPCWLVGLGGDAT